MSFGSENPTGHFGSVDGAGAGAGGPWPGFGAGTTDVEATSGDGVSALAARVDHFHKGVHSVNGAFGDVTVAAFPGFAVAAPPKVASASALGAGATAARGDHTHGQDLSVVYAPSLAALQATGVIQQTYAAPNATPVALTMVAGQVPFGDATPGLLTQSTGLVYSDTAASRKLTVNFDVNAVVPRRWQPFRMNSTTVAAGTSTVGPVVSWSGVDSIWWTATNNSTNTQHNAGVSFRNDLNAGVTGALFSLSAFAGISGGLSGGFLYDFLNADVRVGTGTTALPLASTHGFTWFGPNFTGPGGPTGVPVSGVGTVGSGGAIPMALQEGNYRFWAYMNAQWVSLPFTNFSSQPTRVVFGAATTPFQADNANFTYTTASQTLTLTGTGGLTEAPLVLAVGDTSGRALHLTTGATTITSDAALFMSPGTTFSAGGAGSTDFQIDANHNLALGFQNTLVTTATNGFPFMRTTAGAPTGVPAASYLASGMAPFLYDTTNHKFWVYDGPAAAWKGILLL